MAKTKVVFNRDWLGTFSGLDLIQLMAKTTAGAILQREDFNKRYNSAEPIYLHEMVYPVLQGFDSVHLKADLELGGTDQTFNLMMGRTLQNAYEQASQCILTMPLIEGTDGVNKMSKSMDNYISLTESATDMFGKLMSISDELMKKYWLLLSRRPASEVDAIIAGLKDGTRHPMVTKKDLAEEITGYYHGAEAGKLEREKFEARFSKKQVLDDVEVVERAAGTLALLDLMRELKFVESNGEGRRLLKQNAVKIDGKAHAAETYVLSPGSEVILKVGKLRLVKLKAI
jgi:tyrosyl-tRNA synthetase